jgi:hypothetical protein
MLLFAFRSNRTYRELRTWRRFWRPRGEILEPQTTCAETEGPKTGPRSGSAPPGWGLGELSRSSMHSIASSENEKPFSLHPLRARRPLHPARQITIFLGLRRLLITTTQGHHWPRTAKGALFLLNEADNSLPYASSDQLARNPVQYTRLLLAFSVNAQKILSLRRQKPIRGLCGRRGVSERNRSRIN